MKNNCIEQMPISHTRKTFSSTHMNSHIKNGKGLDKLKETFEQMVSIPESEREYVVPYFPERTFQKNDFIVRAGELSNNFYFIIKGLVRYFYLTMSGKEFNKHFAMENRFAGSLQSLVLNEP